MFFKKISIQFFFIFITVLFTACSTTDVVPVKEVSVTGGSPFSLGIESRDIDIISKKMTADLLKSNFSSDKIPYIILEGEYFINESSNIINTNLLADKMRVNLLREAQGKMFFVTRQNIQLLIKEAETSGKDINIIEADYRMLARISSISKVSNKTGIKTNYFQFAFELLNLEFSTIVWGNIYDFKREGSDDTIHR